MNNTQLDMVLGYLNEGESIDELMYLSAGIEESIRQFDFVNDDFINEGVGSTLLGVIKKIWEFIKGVIEKIKNLIHSVISKIKSFFGMKSKESDEGSSSSKDTGSEKKSEKAKAAKPAAKASADATTDKIPYYVITTPDGDQKCEIGEANGEIASLTKEIREELKAVSDITVKDIESVDKSEMAEAKELLDNLSSVITFKIEYRSGSASKKDIAKKLIGDADAVDKALKAMEILAKTVTNKLTKIAQTEEQKATVKMMVDIFASASKAMSKIFNEISKAMIKASKQYS